MLWKSLLDSGTLMLQHKHYDWYHPHRVSTGHYIQNMPCCCKLYKFVLLKSEKSLRSLMAAYQLWNLSVFLLNLNIKKYGDLTQCVPHCHSVITLALQHTPLSLVTHSLRRIRTKDFHILSGEQLQTVSIFFRSRNLKASTWAMYLEFCVIVNTSFWAELEIKLAFLRCMAQNSKAEIPRCLKMMNSISH